MLSRDKPLKPVLTQVERNASVLAEVVGRLNEVYRLEKALPLSAALCAAVNFNSGPLKVLQPVAL